MKIELKNVKHAAFASEETHCFSATVYLDGVRSGTVSNEGHGGCNRYEPRELETTIDTYAKTLDPYDVSYMYDDGKKHTMESCAEVLIGNLVNDFLEERELKRFCSKKVLFRKPGEAYKKGEYSTMKGKFTTEAKNYLVNKYGADVSILNERFA